MAPVTYSESAETIHIDCAEVVGRIRPLHGVNGGPLIDGETTDLSRHWNDLEIPVTRLHDCEWPFPDVVDMHAVFPQVDANASRVGVLLSNYRSEKPSFTLEIDNLPWDGPTTWTTFILDSERNLEEDTSGILAVDQSTLNLTLPAPSVIFVELRPISHTIDPQSPQDLQELFRYTGEPLPLVSAHRGGAQQRFPENCIATFENTLQHAFAVMEIDPRYTHDGEIVVLHDPTLERTTTGDGLVAEHSLEELGELFLKDTEGNVTPYRIHTLDEVLQWARSKTIIVLDQIIDADSTLPSCAALNVRTTMNGCVGINKTCLLRHESRPLCGIRPSRM